MVPFGSQTDFSDAIAQVGQAGRQLAAAGADVQSRLLDTMATYLHDSQDQILEANTLDLEASLDMAVPELVLDWLKLTPERLQTACKILHRLGSLGDPRVLTPQPISRLTQAMSGYSQVVPLGVVALIYEAFPELAAIMAGLCVRTGNGLILKGGNEASQTTQVILQALYAALEQADLPENCILSLTENEGDAARQWLLQDQGVDLVIPYGRPNLVQQIVRQAAIPVLPTAMGNTYLYWSASGSSETVSTMVVDSHRGEPDAVNAIEKVLIHQSLSLSTTLRLCHNLWEKGFQLLADAALVADIPDLQVIDPKDWSRPFLSRTVALRQVPDAQTAATLVNSDGSHHAVSIVTESYSESNQFTQLVDSAVVYINTSPRFVRNSAQASAIALGMTEQRGRCSGFIGLNALLTTQHVLQGLA